MLVYLGHRRRVSTNYQVLSNRRNIERFSWNFWQYLICSDGIFEIPSSRTHSWSIVMIDVLEYLKWQRLQCMLSQGTETDCPSLSHVYCPPQTADVRPTPVCRSRNNCGFAHHHPSLSPSKSRQKDERQYISVVVLATHLPSLPNL